MKRNGTYIFAAFLIICMIAALIQGFADLRAYPERQGTDCGYPGCVGWKGSNHGKGR